MDAASAPTSRINKVDGSNFHTWKFKMQIPVNVQAQFSQGAGSHLSRVPLVRSANKAHDAWSRLEGHCEKKSLANKLFFRRRFFTAKMDEGDDVLQHINKLKTLTEQLDAVKAPVSEDDLVITLLGSLSDSYAF
ncbi:unnamed protein product [Peronospora destructor]|uniref:Retrotransposon Copia-like N-terminal domain-containing protein n=1 Tax=Peronospora destructor TaxID=86335 RepID=A0AAV0UXD7_9STRA|nr:unnamed protein product [Peronospora destructor]